ncbi:MAG: hypothetical protein IIZ60_07555 [Clostridia bacterium]|nr:hypothetical protein [Clostridia bacterium]
MDNEKLCGKKDGYNMKKAPAQAVAQEPTVATTPNIPLLCISLSQNGCSL